jgi:hypothetical protein
MGQASATSDAKTPGLLARLAALPAIVGLATCAGLAATEAVRLRVAGAWVLWATAAVLAAVAIGLAFRQLWAYLFGLAFWVVSAVGLVALASMVGWQGATHQGNSDWVGVARVVIVGIAFVAAIGAAAAAFAAVALGAAWRAATRGHSTEAWAVSAVVAVAGIGLVGWLVGHQYLYRRLPAQSRCLTANPRTCSTLTRDAERFTRPERLAFAVHGCRAGDDTSCRETIGLLEATHRPESAEVLAVAARCDAGQTDLCRRLAQRFAAVGDVARATSLLERACASDARACSQAAEAAKTAGLLEVERRLLRDGCERDDASSCRRLLRAIEQDGRQDDALALRTCLLGDVNDCVPLMKRDLAGVCEPVCEGSSELRLQSCRRCADEAARAGRRDLAERWWTSACRNNDRTACDALSGGGAKVSPAT